MFTKLDYVYAVYREKSFTRAAEKLFISQPSLSAAIKNVEKEIGAPLFERGRGNIALTEVGKEYINCAERILSIREEFINKINDINSLDIGQIRVGGTNYLSSYVLPRVINRFAELYPNISVNLTEAHSGVLGNMLRNEELDIVIDSFDDNFDEYDVQPLISEEILLCVPKDNGINRELDKYAVPQEAFDKREILLALPPVPIEHFKDESFILLKPGNDMYYRSERFFKQSRIEPKVSFYVDQLNISYALAELGMGICFATDTLFRFSGFPDRISIYKVSGEHSGRTLHIAHKKNRYCTKAMSKFIETAQEVILADRR